MGILRRFLSVSVGVAAGTFAYKLLKDYNDNNLMQEDYVKVPVEDSTAPEQAPAEKQGAQPVQPTAPVQAAQRPDNGPNVNPVTLGHAEKPLMPDGKLDPTKIACAEDFGDWDDLGCQS